MMTGANSEETRGEGRRRRDEKIEAVLNRASKLVTPTRKEELSIQSTVEMVKSLLSRTFSSSSSSELVIPDIFVGGSYAKGTWLKGEADVDFYLLYPKEYPREKLEGEAISLSKKAVSGYRINMRFAEHPYVEAFIGRTRINIVPCYKVPRGEWQSAADRSPYHTDYIKSHFDDRLRLEARLLKKFAKTVGVYGAEVKTQGFSGYVCEVLVLKFGSFLSAVEEISRNQEQSRVISIESYDKDFVASSFESPLVILDPVDTMRNLGSAISARSVAKFMFRSRRFLSRPSISFFQPRPLSVRKGSKGEEKILFDLLSKVVVLKFSSEPRSVDILWGQLRKSLNALRGKLQEIGFDVVRSEAASDEVSQNALIFLLLETKLERYQIRNGPEFFRIEGVDRFIEKNRRRSVLTWFDEVNDGRVCAILPRKMTEAPQAIRTLLAEKKLLESLGLSSEIKKEISRGFVIARGDKILGNKAGSSRRRKRKKDNKLSWLESAVLSIVSSDEDLR
jgi:tRNA nucleotidyltransferase (CCA-adding enzyme)